MTPASRLIAAASKGDQQQVQQLIACGVSPVSVTAAGWSALHAAAMSGQLAVMELLLEMGVPVDLANKWGVNPLHCASSSNQMMAAQLLIKAGAQLEAALRRPYTPLSLAARAGAGDVVKLLLSRGARVQAAHSGRCSPLHEAAWSKDLGVLQLLLDAGAEVDAISEQDFGSTPLLVAALRGFATGASLLMKHGADVTVINKNGNNALARAAFAGEVETAELFLRCGVQVNLIDHGGATPLMAAVFKGHFSVTQLLISQGADVNQGEIGKPIHFAAKFNRYQLLQLLLDSGADVNATDRWGGTALTHAAARVHAEVVQLLLSRGARVSATRHNGETALRDAARNGNARIVQLLLDAGADADASHLTLSAAPICIAAARGHMGAVQLLLKRGGGSRQGVAVAAAEAAARGRHMNAWSLLIRYVRQYFPEAIGECVGNLSARDVAVSLGAAWSTDLITLDQQVKEAQQLKASAQQLMVQAALRHKQLDRLVGLCRAEHTTAAAAATLTSSSATATKGYVVLPSLEGHDGTSKGASSTSPSATASTSTSASVTASTSGSANATASTSSSNSITAAWISSTHGVSGKQGASSGAARTGINTTSLIRSSSPSSNNASAVGHRGTVDNLCSTSSCSGHMGGNIRTSGKESNIVLPVGTAAAHLPLLAGESSSAEPALHAAVEGVPLKTTAMHAAAVEGVLPKTAQAAPSTATCSYASTTTTTTMTQEGQDHHQHGT